jgi:hypothetical protein
MKENGGDKGQGKELQELFFAEFKNSRLKSRGRC